MKTRKIMIMQMGFLVLVLVGLYFAYPKADVSVSGNFVKFDSINANVIMISENSDFSNPIYLDLEEVGDSPVNFKPGTYYWKSANSLIQGFRGKFVVDSEVGMVVDREGGGADLVNVGNVKINITKGGDGFMVGHIILEPEESQEIEDFGEYIGREEK